MTSTEIQYLDTRLGSYQGKGVSVGMERWAT